MMATNRFTDSSGFEEVSSELDKALALVPEYDASKEEETRVITGDTP
ncbi:hypothetical protein SEA_NEFERTHENA_6 [Microbacterium phage Neferthena]|uniref:Uncharacterized protein n=1 Tax=Microbacterium phage Neferthena TaxID=2301539 RepID=A0A385D4F6_9CAUD|nr:hypothetical protein HOT92_gp06 [Microbacterium phage Neferthena]AXQ52870.1 hypothetical protein SEA_NEFERTHENA_6 [Microbacterium phage Neferthena]